MREFHGLPKKPKFQQKPNYTPLIHVTKAMIRIHVNKDTGLACDAQTTCQIEKLGQNYPPGTLPCCKISKEDSQLAEYALARSRKLNAHVARDFASARFVTVCGTP